MTLTKLTLRMNMKTFLLSKFTMKMSIKATKAGISSIDNEYKYNIDNLNNGKLNEDDIYNVNNEVIYQRNTVHLN